MNLGVKFLIGGISLATASCGGYVVYKKISGSNVETTQEPAASENSGEDQAKKQQPSSPSQTADQQGNNVADQALSTSSENR